MRVLVVGAGVIGLTAALRLAQDGHDVHVLARDLPLETTSAVAAALWYPYRAFPPERVGVWAAASYAELARLAEHEPAAGVRMRWGTELLRTPGGDPWWRDAVPALERAVARPPGYADGWRFLAPVVDMGVYLPWLLARLSTHGVTVTRHSLTALPDRGVVVNCAGLASGVLAVDASVTPVRGQVVLVEATGVHEWLLDQSDPAALTYVVPREHSVVVGGTAQEGGFDLRPDPATATAILDRAQRLVPELRGARVLGHRVGLRPARPAVRLETEMRRGGGGVVHCYGHGGAGVTLAWGCAEEVAAHVGALGESP